MTAENSAIPVHIATENNSGSVIARLPILAVLLLGAVICVAFSHSIMPYYLPPNELMVPTPPPEIAIAREKSLSNCRLANAVVTICGVFGLIVGIGLPLVQARTRQFKSVFASVFAVVLGSLLAVGIGHCIMDFINVDPTKLMLKTTIVQIAFLGLWGASLGMALGVGCNQKNAVSLLTIQGFVSGVVGAIVYIVLTSLVLADSQTDALVPAGTLGGSKDLLLFAIWFGSFILAFVAIVPSAFRHQKRA